MPSCEICGAESPTLKRARIERGVLLVCPSCVKLGVEIPTPSKGPPSLPSTRGPPADVYDKMEEVLVPEYPRIVREARIRKGFSTTEELGKKIQVRKTTLDKIEAGTLVPPDDLARKLEKELGITLFERVETPSLGPRRSTGGGVTLGDLLREALEKKGEKR